MAMHKFGLILTSS